MLNKIKAMYPKNAKVNYKNDGNVLWFYISGDSGKQLMIFIKLTWDKYFYEANYKFTNQLTGYTQIDTSASGYTSGNISGSLPDGAIGAWYK